MGQSAKRADGHWACAECGFVYDLEAADVETWLRTAPDSVRAGWNAVGKSGDVPVAQGLWTPRQYLAHLAHWAEIIADRANDALADPNYVVRGIDQDLLATEHAYNRWDATDALARYATSIEGLSAAMSHVDEQLWDRPVRHDELDGITIGKLVQDIIHETGHHLRDIAGTPPGSQQ